MTKPTDKIIEPLDAGFDAVARAVVKPVTKINENKSLASKRTALGPPPSQSDFFHVEKQIVFDGRVWQFSAGKQAKPEVMILSSG